MSPEGSSLIQAARAAARNAHAPYSKFHVGAAVLDADGTVTVGANVESASYGLTCCAERTALFSAYVNGHTHPVELAVTCPDGDAGGDPNSVMPCGACRQVISELAADAVIHVDGVGSFSTDELLPQPFRL
jgi:cytidine deaminase